LDATRSSKPAPTADSRDWPQPPHRSISSPSRAGVLVADNEPGIRRLLEFALGQRGYPVWLAANGEEAVELFELHQHEIAMVILDVLMPILDGPRTLVALRQIAPQVACCFMTASGGEYSLHSLEELGPVRVFGKPFVLSEILETARQLTEMRVAVS
jgi:CheY-like chemotaxis protein